MTRCRSQAPWRGAGGAGVVDWRGFGTEQWRGTGAPAVEKSEPKAAEPSPEEPTAPPPATAADERPSPAGGGAAEASDDAPRALVSEAEAGFLRERVVQLERSIDRLEQLVGRAQELQLAEQRAHDDTRRQLSESQARVVGLLEAPRPEAVAPAAPVETPPDPPPAAADPIESRETGSAEAVTRDVRRGVVRLSRWLWG